MREAEASLLVFQPWHEVLPAENRQLCRGVFVEFMTVVMLVWHGEASAATIRVRLLKIGAAILRNTRCVKVMLASHHLLRELFATAAVRLSAPGP